MFTRTFPSVRAEQGVVVGVPRRAQLQSQSSQQHHASADFSGPEYCQRHPADLCRLSTVHGEQDERKARKRLII